MKYADIILNDVANAPGVCVSFYVQGCPHHCPGCFNPGTWDFEGGKEFTNETLETIINGLTANGIQRSLAILGGEPMCDENIFLTLLVIKEAKRKVPNVKVYIWTGYILEDLLKSSNPHVLEVLQSADVLIDGPFIQEQRDITLKMRGSKNQRVIELDFTKKI